MTSVLKPKVERDPTVIKVNKSERRRERSYMQIWAAFAFFCTQKKGFLSPFPPPSFTSFTMGILKTAKRLVGHTVL